VYSFMTTRDLFLVEGIVLSSKQNKGAGIIGIIFALRLIISIIALDIIDLVLGIMLLFHSIKYLKSFSS